MPIETSPVARPFGDLMNILEGHVKGVYDDGSGVGKATNPGK